MVQEKEEGPNLVHVQANDDMNPSLNLLVVHTSITSLINMEDKTRNECDLKEELGEKIWNIKLVETLNPL
jgi:hypothetical protein